MREVRVRYKHSLLGIGWAVAMPLSMMLVFTFVFTRIAPVQVGTIPYPLFALMGLVPWQLTANVLNVASRSLSDQRNLVTKVYFAREVLPLSAVLSALVDFAVALVLVGALMAWFGVAPGVAIVLAPLVRLVQLALCCGLALLVAGANLLYRDVQFVLQVGVPLWMFASSTVYPIPRTGTYWWLAWLNPMTPIIDAWRAALTGRELALAPEFGVAAGISVLLLFLCWRWFRRIEPRFGELALTRWGASAVVHARAPQRPRPRHSPARPAPSRCAS